MKPRSLTALQCLLLALMVCAANAMAAPDYAREKRWADEIAPALVVGDAVYIAQKSGHKFLAIYTEARQSRGAVIVAHGLGVHPDWGLIGALRSGLADRGYTTLSVQMPVLAATANSEEYVNLFPDAAERLQAAVEFLKAKGHRRIAIASHSMGARMANFFLADSSGSNIDTWIAIGISSGEFADPGKLRLPILDIYGERDLPQVLKNIDARAAVLKTLKGSAQVEVAGANHYFEAHESELIRRIRQFLDRKFN